MPPSTAERIPMSWEDYLALPDSVRGEFIDGALVVSAVPSRIHQQIVWKLADILRDAVGDAAEVLMGWGWKPGTDEFVPDVIVYAPTEEVARLTATPHLAVEVLSQDRSADTIRKFAKYAAAGLPRYWVVDPDGPSLLAFESDGAGGFRVVGDYGPTDQADLDAGPVRITIRPGDLRD